MNDQPQTLIVEGDPVHVAAARLGVGPDSQHIVEFWVEDGDWYKPDQRTSRTF